MNLSRTMDLEMVRTILTFPSIYRQMGDDYLPEEQDFQVVEHPDAWYVLITESLSPLWTNSQTWNILGLFIFFPQNRVCWDIHVAFLDWATKREKLEAARLLVPWLAQNTTCRRLAASVPGCNRRAIFYGTHAIGMHVVGRQDQAFMKYGHLQDLILLGKSVG